MLPDGRFLVSSETEPSIRIFGRNGVHQSQLEIPARFRVVTTGEAGLRVSEVQAYTNNTVLMMEAQYTPEAGNVIKLYAVTHAASAPDVSGIVDLSTDPSAATQKTLIANGTRCPPLEPPPSRRRPIP